MSLRDTALNIVIRARDLASSTLTGIRRQISSTDSATEHLSETSQDLSDSTDNLVDGFDNVSDASASTQRSLRGLATQGVGFLKSKLGALALGAAALAGFGGAIQASREFEAQLSRVGAITSATAGEMEQLKTAAEEAGSSTKYNSTQAAEGLEILARAGYGASESVALLPTLLNVATAEGLELSQAAQLVTDTLSIMGLAIENGAEAADVLAKGASLSNTTMEQLGNAISYAGQFAKTSGFSLEKLVATLDVLAKNGLRGERAGTGLRSILSQLQDPASKAAKAVSDLGIDITDFDAVISGLKGAGDGASEAINAFGVEAGPALRALLDAGVDGLKRYQEELDNAAGTAKKMADDVSNNLDGAIISFDSLIDTLKKKLADPILEPLARDLRDFTASIKQMMPAVESAGSSISFLYDRLSGLVKFFGNSFSVALTSVTAVGLQIPIILAEIELSIDKLLNKAGLVDDATVKRLETEVGALKAARAALVESAVEDANDAAAAINQLFGFIDNAKNKTNSVTQEAADGVKKVGEAAEESSKKAADAAKAHIKAVELTKEALKGQTEEELKSGLAVLDATTKVEQKVKKLSEAEEGSKAYARAQFELALALREQATAEQAVSAAQSKRAKGIDGLKEKIYAYNLQLKDLTEGSTRYVEVQADLEAAEIKMQGALAKSTAEVKTYSDQLSELSKGDIAGFAKNLESELKDLEKAWKANELSLADYIEKKNDLTSALRDAQSLMEDDEKIIFKIKTVYEKATEALEGLTEAKKKDGQESTTYMQAQSDVKATMQELGDEIVKNKNALEDLAESYQNGEISQNTYADVAGRVRTELQEQVTTYEQLGGAIESVTEAEEERIDALEDIADREERMANEREAREASRESAAAERSAKSKERHGIYSQNLEVEADSTQKLTARLEDLNSKIQGSLRGRYKSSRIISQTIRDLRTEERALVRDELQWREYSTALQDGTLSADEMQRALTWARSSARSLDNTKLDSLVASIKAAKQEMIEFREESEDALASINQELAEAKGDYASATESRYQQRIEDLEDKLNEAKERNDNTSADNYRKAINELKELKAIEVAAAKQEALALSSGSSGTNGETSGTQTTTSRVVNIQLGNKTQAVRVADSVSEDALISALEEISAASL